MHVFSCMWSCQQVTRYLRDTCHDSLSVLVVSRVTYRIVDRQFLTQVNSHFFTKKNEGSCSAAERNTTLRSQLKKLITFLFKSRKKKTPPLQAKRWIHNLLSHKVVYFFELFVSFKCDFCWFAGSQAVRQMTRASSSPPVWRPTNPKVKIRDGGNVDSARLDGLTCDHWTAHLSVKHACVHNALCLLKTSVWNKFDKTSNVWHTFGFRISQEAQNIVNVCKNDTAALHFNFSNQLQRYLNDGCANHVRVQVYVVAKVVLVQGQVLNISQ